MRKVKQATFYRVLKITLQLYNYFIYCLLISIFVKLYWWKLKEKIKIMKICKQPSWIVNDATVRASAVKYNVYMYMAWSITYICNVVHNVIVWSLKMSIISIWTSWTPYKVQNTRALWQNELVNHALTIHVINCKLHVPGCFSVNYPTLSWFINLQKYKEFELWYHNMTYLWNIISFRFLRFRWIQKREGSIEELSSF